MPKIPGINHRDAVRALQKAGFRIVRESKHIVMSDGTRILIIPRGNPVRRTGIVPASEPEDALHVAIATVSKMHYLVTWNFAHLAGPDAKQKLLDGLRALGHSPPLLTTPEELLETAK
jgi:predicted RNA binding protein YcfA (HicA-like mRNA interferase family)